MPAIGSGAISQECFASPAVAGASAPKYTSAPELAAGELWSALSTGRVGRHLYVPYTFAFVLFFIAYAPPETVAAAFTAALPIVSVAVLATCKREPRRKPSVRYICDELSIAQDTAKRHVRNLYRKVGVRPPGIAGHRRARRRGETGAGVTAGH